MHDHSHELKIQRWTSNKTMGNNAVYFVFAFDVLGVIISIDRSALVSKNLNPITVGQFRYPEKLTCYPPKFSRGMFLHLFCENIKHLELLKNLSTKICRSFINQRQSLATDFRTAKNPAMQSLSVAAIMKNCSTVEEYHDSNLVHSMDVRVA